MRFAALVTLVLASGGAPAQPDPALRAAAAFYDGVRVETLSNGMRVVLKPVPGSPTVTTMVAYKVGAADEALTATGLSHYLEHLMFKGTDKLVPGDIDRMTMRGGGRNNAWTSPDLTTYHFDFAADRWEAALGIEADRMRNLRIDDKHEFQQEKGAVIAELDRDEDNPFQLEHKAILPRLFGKDAPYGHPVIGERGHVREATAEVIKGHYDRWYHPNNAVLVIAGGFDPDRAMAVIREKFGSIPAGNLPERKTASPSTRSQPERHEFDSKFEVPRLVMGFNTVVVGDADEFPLDVAAVLLSGGKTGRLYRTLVEEKRVASVARASHQPGRYPGWFAVEVELLPGKSTHEAEQLVLAELKKLADEPVTDDELKRAKRLLVANEVFTKEGVHELAQDLAVGVSLRGLDQLRDYLPRLSAVTAADVQRVARKYLDANTRVAVWSKPKGAGGASERPADKPRRAAGPSGTGGGYDLTAAQRVVLPNGLTLLLLENRRLPVVSARAHVRGVRLSEPAAQAGVAALTGALLDEGAAGRPGAEIAAAIESVGGELSFTASGGSVRVLSPDLPLGLRLLLECLTKADFPAEAFDRLREQSVAALDEAQLQADTRAELAFNSVIYGDHPYGRPSLGTKDALAELTPDACRRFHAATYLPERTVLAVVGDFDAAKVRAEVERFTADWRRGEVPAPTGPTLKKREAPQETVFSMADAAQLYLYLGHLGIRRSDPDYYKLLVMDYVLGTGPGFTDRLSSKLRDRMGLAYTVSATITSNAGEEPGTFACYIGTFPDKLAIVRAAFLSEIRKLQDQPPSTQEVEDAKQYLLGSIAFRFGTSEQVAEQLVLTERFGLGLDYLAEFRRQVGAVSPADVRDVARKHLSPDRMVVIAAGPVDARGKALRSGGR